MSFFEPLPPAPPPMSGAWSAPAWDRPSEGTLPALLPVNELVLRSDTAVAELESLRVYTNGFVVQLTALFDPRGTTHWRFMSPGFGGHDPAQRFPRVGVRFADGREGGRKGPIIGQEPTRKDEHGLPLDPIVRPTGGGGGAHAYHFGAWVFPLPPDGPLEIYVSLPAVSPAEGHVALDGSDVRAAASHAKVIWS